MLKSVIFLLELKNYFCSCSAKAKSPWILCGDVNINLLNVDSDNKVVDLVDLINSHALLPVIYNLTSIIHHSATLIDNIFVSKLNPSVSDNLCIEIADHLPSFTIINYLHDIKTLSSSILNTSNSKLNYTKIDNNLNSRAWDFIIDISDVNSDYNHFLNIIRNDIQASIDVDKIHYKNHVKHKIQPWIRDGLITSCKEKNKLFWDVLHGKFSQDIYKNYKNKLTRLLRTAKRNYFTNFSSQHKSNTKAVWTLINKHINKVNHFKTCSLNADEMKNFFASAGVNAVKHLKVPNYNETYCMPPTVCKSFFKTPVTEHEVLESVQGLKTKKSYGFDRISTHTILNRLFI